MTLGAGAFALAGPPGVAAAMPIGVGSLIRSPSSDEAGFCAGKVGVSPASAHPARDPSAIAGATRPTTIAERAAMRNKTLPSTDKPPSAGAARTTLAAQADLWQGLHICTSAGSPGTL